MTRGRKSASRSPRSNSTRKATAAKRASSKGKPWIRIACTIQGCHGLSCTGEIINFQRRNIMEIPSWKVGQGPRQPGRERIDASRNAIRREEVEREDEEYERQRQRAREQRTRERAREQEQESAQPPAT